MKVQPHLFLFVILLALGSCCKEPSVIKLTGGEKVICSQLTNTIRYTNFVGDTLNFVLVHDSIWEGSGANVPVRCPTSIPEWREVKYENDSIKFRITIKKGIVNFLIQQDNQLYGVIGYSDLTSLPPLQYSISDVISSTNYQVLNNQIINGRTYPQLVKFQLQDNTNYTITRTVLLSLDFGIVSFENTSGDVWKLL